MNQDRRNFLLQSAAAAATVSQSAGQANNRLRVAAVGIHGQGGEHIKYLVNLREQNVELAALCDVDESQLTRRMGELEKVGVKPATFTDFRKLLEDKTIDAVSIATPNHNHTLQTVWACQAGKDVYIEKPLSHTFWEGRKVVEAAAKYKRIVQHGTQSRTSHREGIQKLREGIIGDVYMARMIVYKWRNTIGRKPDEAVPPGVHYDMWLGPAPKRAFNQNRFHYNWHWNWDYGNSEIGNQGIHQMDLARWGLGVTLPVKVQAMGGHFMFDDDQQTPNTQMGAMEFNENGQKKLLTFEVRHWISNNEAAIGPGGEKNTVGNIFYGTKGYMTMDGSSWKTYIGRKQEPGPSGSAPHRHHENWVKAIRSRDVRDLNSPPEEGHYSCALMHLANIAFRTGRTINFDPQTETILHDAEAAKLLTRTYRAPYVVPRDV